MRRIAFSTRAVPDRPALDTALSRSFLDLVAAGEAPETFRLYRPDDVLAFSGLDAVRPGFREAVAAARARAFAPMLRLAGGRAAVFLRESLAFAWSIPTPDPRTGVHERFQALAELVSAALRSLGVDARVGEVPGEYCPGEWSVNARGAVKLMGVGQRMVRGAAHVGGVIVVGASGRAREVLAPVYGALDYPLDLATVGAVEDEAPGATPERVAEALRDALGQRFALTPADEAVGEVALSPGPPSARRATTSTPPRLPRRCHPHRDARSSPTTEPAAPPPPPRISTSKPTASQDFFCRGGRARSPRAARRRGDALRLSRRDVGRGVLQRCRRADRRSARGGAPAQERAGGARSRGNVCVARSGSSSGGTSSPARRTARPSRSRFRRRSRRPCCRRSCRASSTATPATSAGRSRERPECSRRA